MAINYHAHLHGCTHNESIKRICLACRFDEWQRTKRIPLSILGKTFEQQLTQADAKLLHEMLIGV